MTDDLRLGKSIILSPTNQKKMKQLLSLVLKIYIVLLTKEQSF